MHFWPKKQFSANPTNGCFSVIPARTGSVVIFLMAWTVPPSFVENGPKLRVLILNWHKPRRAKKRGEPWKIWPKIGICGHFGPNIGIFGPFCHMPYQNIMQTRCLGGFSVMWVPKPLLSPVKIRIFALKRHKFAQKMHFWSFWARPWRLIWCPVDRLVGGCGARAVSRKISIYFI